MGVVSLRLLPVSSNCLVLAQACGCWVSCLNLRDQCSHWRFTKMYLENVCKLNFTKSETDSQCESQRVVKPTLPTASNFLESLLDKQFRLC